MSCDTLTLSSSSCWH